MIGIDIVRPTATIFDLRIEGSVSGLLFLYLLLIVIKTKVVFIRIFGMSDFMRPGLNCISIPNGGHGHNL